MTEITIYTTAGAVTYVVRDTCDNFKEKLTAALEQGTTTVETIEGSNLIVNPLNAAAIEVKEIEEANPPGR